MKAVDQQDDKLWSFQNFRFHFLDLLFSEGHALYFARLKILDIFLELFFSSKQVIKFGFELILKDQHIFIFFIQFSYDLANVLRVHFIHVFRQLSIFV